MNLSFRVPKYPVRVYLGFGARVNPEETQGNTYNACQKKLTLTEAGRIMCSADVHKMLAELAEHTQF